jgi:hypothetical protein
VARSDGSESGGPRGLDEEIEEDGNTASRLIGEKGNRSIDPREKARVSLKYSSLVYNNVIEGYKCFPKI